MPRTKAMYVALTFSWSGRWRVVYHGWPGLSKNLVEGLARQELIPNSDEDNHLKVFSKTDAWAWYPEAMSDYKQSVGEYPPTE